MPSKTETNRLKDLALKWMSIAQLPEMEKRKGLWRELKNLNAHRPMILVETDSIKDFVLDKELICEEGFLRNVEKNLVNSIIHFEKLGDDIVLEPYFRLEWQIHISDYGVEVKEEHSEEAGGLGLRFNHPLTSIEDIKKLRKRVFTVGRGLSHEYLHILRDIFGDILPVKLGNYSELTDTPGYAPYLGVNFICLLFDLFKLMGNDNLLIWPYDYPEDVEKISKFLTGERLRFFDWIEDEELLDFNTDNQGAGPGSYGYCSDLPSTESPGPAQLADCWGKIMYIHENRILCI